MNKLNKLFLGKVKKEIKSSQSYNPENDHLWFLGEKVYIEKHKWDCGWYWGFGYIGNKNLHCHADIFVKNLIWHKADEVFEKSIFKNENDFWLFKDYLKQAYVLKKCAEVYRLGGHCVSKGKIIVNKEMEDRLNKDLEIVLNALWNLLEELSK
jgi:hypothetical protein